MSGKSSVNEFSLIKANNGSASVEMSGNAQMTNYVGDSHVTNININSTDNSIIPTLSDAVGRAVKARKIDLSDKLHRLCNAVNKQTLRAIAVKITEDFKEDKLIEPGFKVYPQMKKVENFFKGGYEEYEEKEELDIISERKVMQNQLRREVGFHYDARRHEDKSVTKDELLASIIKENRTSPQNTNPVTAVVASAGSGKTTFLRRLTQETLNTCSIFSYEGKPEVEQSHFKMVYYIELKDMDNEEKLKPSQLLFGGLYENESDEDEAYRWLLDHQSEAILYFDGLDQAPWSIDKHSQRGMRPFQKGSTSCIMYNLLSHILLPHVKIVFASREFKVSELPAKARPDEIISLVGLTRKDAKMLFIALVKDHGANIWAKIKNLSPRLLNLLSVPVFLVITAVVMANDPHKPPPATITELYNRILLSLRHIETIQEREQIMDVIKKLKEMAHQGMVEGRVVFKESDLKMFGLSIQDVRDLMMKVPGNNILSCHLIEGDFLYFFCHQSLQEFLSASHVAGMENKQFYQFNDNHLHESRWSVVRTFVSGIIYQQFTSELHGVSDHERKQEIFAKTIRTRIAVERYAEELVTAIYESNSDELIQSLPALPSIRFTPLGLDTAHMYSSIWARTGKVKKDEKVDLEVCGLDDELLDVMVQNLKDLKIQVGTLALALNSITADGMKPFLACVDAEEIAIDFELLIDFRYEDLDWNKFRKIDWGVEKEIQMWNKEEVIAIEGFVSGCFDKRPRDADTDQRLTLHYKDDFAPCVLDLMIFFQQKYFQVAFEDHIYVEMAHLAGLKDLNTEGKIPKMILSCRWEKNIESSLIEYCFQKFQVWSLDIFVNEETSFIPSNFLAETAPHISKNVKVHWWFSLSGPDDVTKLISIIQPKQVDYLRLRIRSGTSFDNIKTIIESCKMKEITLVYGFEEFKSKMKHEDIVVFAKQYSIKVESAIEEDEKGAWKEADQKDY